LRATRLDAFGSSAVSSHAAHEKVSCKRTKVSAIGAA
jgi:hypothetical protein